MSHNEKINLQYVDVRRLMRGILEHIVVLGHALDDLCAELGDTESAYWEDVLLKDYGIRGDLAIAIMDFAIARDPSDFTADKDVSIEHLVSEFSELLDLYKNQSVEDNE